MREKLEKIVAAYGELEAKMGDPAVVSNQSEYNKLAKDYANQGELARAAKEYLGLMDDLAAAKEMLGDADMKEFAQEEIASIEARMPQLEEDIKTRRTSSSRFAQVQVAMKRQSLQAISITCTRVSLLTRGGSARPWICTLLRRAVSRRSRSRCWAIASIPS